MASETYSGETGDINAGQVRRYTGCGFVRLAEPVKAGVGDRDTRFLRGKEEFKTRVYDVATC